MTGTRYPARRVDVESIEALNPADFGDNDLLYQDSAEANLHDNTRRAGFAVPALLLYAETTGLRGEDVELAIGDLLGNLLHLCDSLGLEFDALVRSGREHYDAEVTGNWA